MSPLSWLLPSGKITLHHSQNNQLLLTKKASSEDGKETQVTLAELCRLATPSTCQLNPLLFNGHLQTAWTTVKNIDIPIYYKRKIFEAENAYYSGQFAIDFVVPPYETPTSDEATDKDRIFTLPSGLPARTSFFTAEEFAALPSDDNRPMLIALHGLTGGSYELYLRHALAPLVLGDGGWEACVLNARGCAQTKISSGVLFNARATWDLRQAVRWLRKTFPNRPLFGIGFSLGANILTNYLGEEGENCQLKAAVICANPWNLELTSHALQQSWLGLEVYSKTMGANLKRLFNQHAEEVSKNARLDVEAVQKVKYIHEFDSWGYPTEGAYYRDASSVDSLLAIRVPFLAINAEDDPISVKEAIPYNEFAQTPYGVLLTTSWGGHLGWFEIGGSRWFTKPAANFLNLMAKEIDLNAPFVPENKEMLYGRPVANGSANKDVDKSPKPEFDPMRRKMYMSMD
ncbi:hypothetical protein T310_1446 [Rasamsonia emersonii CBS 393.64]|uniref:alcohol O-acetyltransferase n=1 Tax=Rasamsonia emersonii (strain ATCC 16479 / CBS 393.64 / IMI 116815) TaxID=1408163 RepID=A0A0F4Z2E8_RASE3|nr:hypothetical protein T310_1446 [Rasamsonia emersonii CBS 393.64]KKA24545.1 hypothetical protein T310_1446 [Rasamsonia emersonii CBS 393.64]